MRTAALIKAKIHGTTFLSGGVFRQMRERDQLWVLPLAAVGIAVAAGVSVYLFFQNFVTLAALGAAAGSPGLPLYAGILAAWILVFVIGFPLAISILYLSRDTHLLMVLPLKPYQIVTANLFLVYIYALPLALAVFVPAVVAYLQVAPLVPMSVISIVVIGLLLPVVPIALSVVLVMLLTRIVNFSRHRTAFEAVGMVFLLVAIVGMQLVFSRGLIESGGEGLMQAGLARFVLTLQKAVPPAAWGARAFTSGGAARLLLFVLFSFAPALLVGVFAQSGYLRQIAEQPVARARRRRTSAIAIAPQRSVLGALIGREIRTLASNSTFLFESVGELLIFPIILVVVRFSIPQSIMDQVMPILDGFSHTLPALFALLLLMAGINTVSATAISREGRTFDLSLSIPVPGAEQMWAKIATYLLMFLPAFAMNSGLAIWILRLPWWNAVVLSVGAVPILLLLGLVTISADIRRPLLTWTHPQQAVKQNLNVLVGLGLSILTVGVLGAPAVFAAFHGAGDMVVILIVVVLAVVGDVLLARAVGAYANTRYSRAFAR